MIDRLLDCLSDNSLLSKLIGIVLWTIHKHLGFKCIASDRIYHLLLIELAVCILTAYYTAIEECLP